MKRTFISLVALACGSALASAQPPSPKWEELTAEDFVSALARSANTCLLPFGIIEKHGPSGPLGTDLIDVRQITAKAVEREYTLVFPEYYFGQIFEAQHQPGTIASALRCNCGCSRRRWPKWRATAAKRLRS